MTDGERETFLWVAAYRGLHPWGPSHQEIARGVKHSLATVNKHVRRLEESGLLTRTPGTTGTLRLTEEGKTLWSRLANRKPVSASSTNAP